jgi:hypothetical protein
MMTNDLLRLKEMLEGHAKYSEDAKLVLSLWNDYKIVMDLYLNGGEDFFGGRFPPDGAWTPNGRRIDPCTLCGLPSVSRRQGNYEVWWCEGHDRLAGWLWSLILDIKHKR